MSHAPVSETRPLTFRLPLPGTTDPYFGFSRSFYYVLERRGELKFVRILGRDAKRGVTLVPFEAVEKFIRREMENAK
jgi:hypothetical protein